MKRAVFISLLLVVALMLSTPVHAGPPPVYTVGFRVVDGYWSIGYTQTVVEGESIDWGEVEANYPLYGGRIWEDVYMWLFDITGNPLWDPNMPIMENIILTPYFYPDDTALVYINGTESVATGAGAVVSYTISARHMPAVSGIELEFEVDGDFLSSKEFTAGTDFSFMEMGNYGTPIFWKNVGNIWIGKATLISSIAGGASGDADIFTMVFDVREGSLGTADVKINYVKMSYAAVAVPVVVAKGVATTEFVQYYSPFDVNKDGVIDLNDLTFAMQYLTAKAGDANWDEAKIADVNNSGEVDIDDLIEILANYTVPYYS